MLLEQHFNYKTFTESATAKQCNIENNPPDEIIIHNLTKLHSFLLEIQARVSTKFGKLIPIQINSAYRSKELNEKVGGSRTSEHTQGLASDTVAIGISLDEFYSSLKELAKKNVLTFGQVIREPRWVHISLKGKHTNNFMIKEHGKPYKTDKL